MPYKFEKISINNPAHDRRVKLTEEDKESVRSDYKTGLFSQRDLAKKYGVSRRLIQFVLSPEKAERAKKQLAERRKDGRYYDKDKHRNYMRNHREYKKGLYQKGLLDEDSNK